MRSSGNFKLDPELKDSCGQHSSAESWLIKRVRHLSVDKSCGRCQGRSESLCHLLRDCPAAKAICSNFLPREQTYRLFQGDLSQWMQLNLVYWNVGRVVKWKWGELFSTCCWLIWKCRKLWSFSGSDKTSCAEIGYCSQSSTDWTPSHKSGWVG